MFSKLPLHFPEKIGPSESLPPGPFPLNLPLQTTKMYFLLNTLLFLKVHSQLLDSGPRTMNRDTDTNTRSK